MKIQFTVLASFLLCLAFHHAAHAELEGFFPEDGGKITVAPTAGPIHSVGIEFVPLEGTVTQGETAEPFMFFIPNASAPGNVTLAVLGTGVTIDGPVTLDVTASADAVISATWGKGVTPIPFPVTGGGGIFGLKGSFPYGGGPMTIEPRFEGNPYTATELSLEATAGTLTGGGSAAPFASLSENTAQKWTASSAAGVTIDGQVVLDLQASADASISGLANDGTESSTVAVVRRDPEPTTALKGSFSFQGGPITIESTAGPVVTRGLDLSIVNEQGRFLSSANASPAPYDSLDSSSPSVFQASSSTDVVIDGRVTLDANVTSDASVKGIMQDENSSKLFGIDQRPSIRMNGSYPYGGGPITLTGRRANLYGVNLTATQGSLAGGGDASPFESLDANDATNWSVSSAAAVSIEGSVTLDVAASDGASISATYDDGYNDTEFSMRETPPPFTGTLRGTFPVSGGPITIEPTAGPVMSRGLDLTSSGGALTSDGSPAPFETLATNNQQQWSARSATDVTIDGPVTLDVDVNNSESSVTGASLSSTGWEGISISRKFPNNTGGLQGTFPNEGGPITVAPTAGPVASGGIQITAVQGTIMQGVDAAPFAFFIPNAAVPNQVTWGNLGTPVTIDGPVTLDATASFDAVLDGSWGDGTTPVSMPITQGGTIDPGTGGGSVMDNPPLNQESIDIALEDLDPIVLESQLLVLFPEGGGPLTIMGTNGPVSTLGIEFVAEPGMLFAGDSAAPFEFFIDNNAATGNVVLASLGVPVVIDEPITLDIFAASGAVLSGQWGEGTLATFPAFAVPNNVVPEPSSQLLVMFGVLGLLSFRRRTALSPWSQ